MSSLRERRHAQTRADIVAVAFELFAELGFAQVSMEEIARAAGVSRSTAYRRFASKEDVILEVPRRWLHAFDEAVGSLPPDTELADAVSAGACAVAAHIDANIEIVRAAYVAVEEAPALKAAGVMSTDWLERVTELTLAHSDYDEAEANIIAGAVMGAIDAMMYRWSADGGTGSVVTATRQVLDRLRPMLH